MILKHPAFSFDIFLKERINTLVVENLTLYRTLLEEWNDQIEMGSGRFLLMEDLEEISLKKLEVVYSPFLLDMNNKKILNRMYQEIKGRILEDSFRDYQQLERMCLKFAENHITNWDIDLEIKDSLEIIDFFKLIDLKIRDEKDIRIPEKILNYILSVSSYLSPICFVFISFRDYFSDAEFQIFLEEIALRKISVLFIESHNTRLPFRQEKVYTIDNDLCEIF